jgi:uncharacterized protein YgiB involved in biofilm formation
MRKTAIALAAMMAPMLLAACESRPQTASYQNRQDCIDAGRGPGTAGYTGCLRDQHREEMRNFSDLTVHGPAGGNP